MSTFANDCWFLTGPTASGKSSLGLKIAERFGCEILALDSMTLYRELDIGTAKPSAADRQTIPHHLIDLLDPSEPSTVDLYLQKAEQACAEIRVRGHQPLFVGGTPMYLKTLLRGLFEGPGADPALRERLEREAEEIGTKALHARLAMIDPNAVKKIHPSDLRRIIRALEVFELTGVPISQMQREFDRPADPPPKAACIVRPRAEMHQRIEQRIDQMFAEGWIEETQRLKDRTPPVGREARQAVGYSEILAYLDGTMDRTEARFRTLVRTRQFCKNQMTWFRHLQECTFFETSQSETDDSLLQRLCAFFAGDAVKE